MWNSNFLILLELTLLITTTCIVNPRGVTHHKSGYAPMSKKKALKRCVLQTYGIVHIFLYKGGGFFIVYYTLGVTRNKNLQAYIQNGIIGYHYQHHNN